MATFYFTQNGAGSKNGTSLGNAWDAGSTSTGISNAGNWGAGKIEAGAVVIVGDSVSSRITMQGSGSAATVAGRIWFKCGVGGALTAGINGNGKDYIGIVGCSGSQVSTSNTYWWIDLGGCDGWLIYHNSVANTFWGAIGNNTAGNNNIIRRNSFNDICSIDGGSASNPVVEIYGDSNLIEYNSVLKSLDRTRCYGTGCIVRNNYWGATDPSYYPNTSPYPHHTDGYQGQDASTIATKLLYEANWDEDNSDSVGGTNGHSFIAQFSTNSSWFMVRFNGLIRPSGPDSIIGGVDDFIHYNNTGIGIGSGYVTPGQGNAIYYQSPTCARPFALNDTWCYSPSITNSSGGLFTGTPSGEIYDYLHSYNTSGTQPAYPASGGANNLAHSAPSFTDGTGVAPHDDYTLQSGSILRAAGGPLTTASNSGSGSTALTVASSTIGRRFCDGWGIVDGDWIKIGSGAYVQVTAVSGANITLGAARTWSSSDVIRVRGMEDVGCFPYGCALAPTISSGVITSLNGTATITVGDAFNVRFCELEIDGIPVASSYTPSGNVFSLTWSGDGSAGHTFKAVAYAKWPSKTPTVELEIFSGSSTRMVKSARVPKKCVTVTVT